MHDNRSWDALGVMHLFVMIDEMVVVHVIDGGTELSKVGIHLVSSEGFRILDDGTLRLRPGALDYCLLQSIWTCVLFRGVFDLSG